MNFNEAKHSMEYLITIAESITNSATKQEDRALWKYISEVLIKADEALDIVIMSEDDGK